MSSVMERLCCGCWSVSRKRTPASDNDADALIEGIDLPVRSGTRSCGGGGGGDVFSWLRRLPERRRVHQGSHRNDAGIAVVSRGRIKYVNDGPFSSSHVPVPIIDPLIGRTDGHHQRQLFPQLQLRGAGIFHSHRRQQQWWDSGTPPSSVDLEWEHEGLMAPEDAGAEVAPADGSDEEDEDEATVRRSPSPGSACHSLEWDGDDFTVGLGDRQRRGQTAAAFTDGEPSD